MSRSGSTLQCKFAKLDELSIVNVKVGLRLAVLGDDALACRYLSLDHTRSGHVIRMHVCVDCTDRRSDNHG